MDAALKLLAVVLCVLVSAFAWSGLFWLMDRAARRRCCTGIPSTHWLADRCEECGRRTFPPRDGLRASPERR